jgi:hypothetical protein
MSDSSSILLNATARHDMQYTASMGKLEFQEFLTTVTSRISTRPLDDTLERELNEWFPPNGEFYTAVLEACKAGDAAGWICEREGGGIRYGRVIKPGPVTENFSVDVVEMKDLVGPHHVHPNGEIDLIMPLEGDAAFDNHRAGWMVYRPGSSHRPTVTGGRAYVLYLLPGGAIEFTRA